MLRSMLAIVTLAFLLFAGVSPALAQAAAQSTVVKLTDVPDAVQKTIQKQVAKGKLNQIEKFTEDGVTTFEVEMHKGGRPHTFTVSEYGDLLNIEVFLGETPVPVREAIKKRATGAELEGITKVFENGNVSFEADITRDGKTRTYTFDNKGELIELELSLIEAPAPVQQAIQRVTGVHKLGDITELFEDGETNFEVEINPDEKGPVMTFDSKGEVLSVEEAVLQSKLTPAAQKTLTDLLKSDRLVSLTKTTEDGEVSYNADIRRADKWEAVTIGADGKVQP